MSGVRSASAPWVTWSYRALGLLHASFWLVSAYAAAEAGRLFGNDAWPYQAGLFGLSGGLGLAAGVLGPSRRRRLGVVLWATAAVIGLMVTAGYAVSQGPTTERLVDLAIATFPPALALLLLRRARRSSPGTTPPRG